MKKPMLTREQIMILSDKKKLLEFIIARGSVQKACPELGLGYKAISQRLRDYGIPKMFGNEKRNPINFYKKCIK